MQITIGHNDPKPTERPAPGMVWIRMEGGPLRGQWVERDKAMMERWAARNGAKR